MAEGLTYSDRNRILGELGYASYADYLDSPLWKSIRRRVLRGKTKCRRCHRPAKQVHHLDYCRDTLLGRFLSGLAPICRACHEAIEFDAKGRKRTLVEANAALSQTRPKKPKKKSKLNRTPKKETPAYLRRSGAIICEVCRLLTPSAKETGVCKNCQERGRGRKQPHKPGAWDLVPKPEPLQGHRATVRLKVPAVCQGCGKSRPGTRLLGLCRKCYQRLSGPGKSKRPAIELHR